MSKKLTPWFPPHVNPIHEGVYISTLAKSEKFYRRWTKNGWTVGGRTVEVAEKATRLSVMHGLLHWRGLAEKP